MNFTNPKNIKYDKWIHWNVTGKCNFECEYCFGHSAVGYQQINYIDVDKLVKTLDGTENIFRISFTGGEPFLIPNFIYACQAITKKHYISINTHFASNKVIEFSEIITPERVLFIQASLHFAELKKRKLTQKYIYNFKLLKSLNFNIFAEAVAYPQLVDKLNEYRTPFDDEGIEFSFGAFTGVYKSKKYPESYTNEELELFKLDTNEECKFFQKGNLCNAGNNAVVAFSTGNVFPCFQIKQKLGNIYESINFEESLIKCPAKYCGCPLNIYDSYLFAKVNQ